MPWRIEDEVKRLGGVFTLWRGYAVKERQLNHRPAAILRRRCRRACRQSHRRVRSSKMPMDIRAKPPKPHSYRRLADRDAGAFDRPDTLTSSRNQRCAGSVSVRECHCIDTS